MKITQPNKVRDMLEKVSASAASHSRSRTVGKVPSPKFLTKVKNQAFSGYDLKAVRKWVASEERIVHDFQQDDGECEELNEPTLSAAPAAAAPLPPKHLKSFGPRKSVAFWGRFFLGTIVLSAAFFAILYLHQNFFRKTIAPSNPVSKKTVLGPPAAPVSDPLETVRRLKKEVQELTQDLRAARKKEQQFQNREKDYRNELFQMTLAYEEKLSGLRQGTSAKDDLIRSLRASLREAEANLRKSEQAATAGPFSEKTFRNDPVPGSGAATRSAPRRSEGLRGKVVMVNSRYEFVVIDAGAEKGVRPGQKVVFYKSGRELAVGVVERVYPTLSGAAVPDTGALAQIQEGEDVSIEL